MTDDFDPNAARLQLMLAAKDAGDDAAVDRIAAMTDAEILELAADGGDGAA